jgi:mRNA-degrading endonuclease toxin of MazEF toxin-antitoxin module
MDNSAGLFRVLWRSPPFPSMQPATRAASPALTEPPVSADTEASAPKGMSLTSHQREYDWRSAAWERGGRMIQFAATEDMRKDFLQWMGLKGALHERHHEPPYVSNGDIWWASVGENVGSEINGKSNQFSRPVIIYKKLSHSFYFVVPTTTQEKQGTWFVPIRQRDTKMFACLHQARAIDYRRLSSKLGTLDDEDLDRVHAGFRSLYK